MNSKRLLGDCSMERQRKIHCRMGYDTFETALASLIENSLRNLWSNGEGERRLISVELLPSRISIFDTGPGMDGAAGNLEKWGEILASFHQLKGGETPYSMPFFGMFGYGGPVAATCFGKRAVISSKTKNCDKVLTVNLETESSVSSSCSEMCWRTKGGMRDPLNDETEKSLHGSFTKVEIFDPKVKNLDIKRLRCKLKDIFFPYIKCAEVSGKTSPPIEFQVNGIDLSEVCDREEVVANLNSCNGPDINSYAARWKIINHDKDILYKIRVGSYLRPLYLSCVDRYNNCVQFTEVPKLSIELNSNGKVLAHVRRKKVDVELGNSTIKIKDFFIKSTGLDDIRPNYEATLTITNADKTCSAEFPCRVIPGTPEKITLCPPTLTRLIPGQIIKELSLEVLDVYGNHVEEGEIILLRVKGLTFQDGNESTDCMKKVDAHGFVDLRNSLKVSDGYGKHVSLSIIFKDRVIFQQQFPIIELRDITSVRKELEDDLITSACAMNDLKRELESLQYAQLHIQQEIKYLQGEPRRLFFEASPASQLAEKKLELANMNEHLEEANKAYTQAIEMFLTTRDKYNNLTRIGSSSVSGTRK